ncbi:MAG TPA: universal stress protein [Bryobacteraceae bacterium]|nr:universal stress protein [Bryobacteraceae bacterium]
MTTPQTIILPVDFSARAAVTAAHARVLANQYGSAIVAVHVMRPFQLAAEGVDVPSAVVLDWYTQQRPLLEKQLADFVDHHLAGCKVTPLFCEGDPATEIIRVARQWHADLIMIGTHGYSPFRRFLLGSVAAKVLSDSPIPVLTGAHVEAPASDVPQVSAILVATDVDARSSHLIAAGAELAKSFGAALHVVHASPDDGAGAGHYVDPSWRIEIARLLQERIEKTAAEAGIDVKVHVIPGEAAKVVRQVAETVHADLVVLGRHSDKGLLGRLRTHSYAIIRESPCPVLSV